MDKPFLTYDQQIALLESKGLLISDRSFAIEVLQKIGYFRLVGGYKSPFKHPFTGKYLDGARIEDLVALYDFDARLRELFLQHILQVEGHVRSLVSYCFSEKYGECQLAYLTQSNFNPIFKDSEKLNLLIGELQHLATKKADYPYINHQRDCHGNVPLWVLIHAVTFGKLSKIYSYLTPDLQTKVSIHFPEVTEKQLSQFLSVLTRFRNVCAHGERLFSQKIPETIPDMLIHATLKIPRRSGQYTRGKQDLFAVVIGLYYLLPHDVFFVFQDDLLRLIARFLLQTSSITQTKILDLMGFPPNWYIHS